MRVCAVRKVSRPVIAPVSLDDLMRYIDDIASEDVPEYLENLLDKKIIRFMLSDPVFSKSRVAYGAYIDGVLCGFSIIQHVVDSLDLLHVHEDYRNMGVGSRLIEYSGIKRVVVNKKNSKALSLYRHFSLEVHYDDD